jgi:hypothetical protein
VILIRTDTGNFTSVKHYRADEADDLLNDVRAALNTIGVVRLEIITPESEEW